MALTEVKQAWSSYYQKFSPATLEKGAEDAARWTLKKAPWTHNQLRRRLFVRLGIGQGMTLLQAGSGVGKSGISEALLAGCQVTLLDYSERALESAQWVIHRLAQRSPQLTEKVKFLQAALEDLPLENCFDVTFNEGVLEHWFSEEERVAMVRHMVKPTKIGGQVIVFVPNENNTLYRRRMAKLRAQHSPVPPERGFTSEELRQDMVAAGLADVRVFGFAPHLSFGSYTGLRALALVAWTLQSFLPRRWFELYADRFGFFLVGIGTKQS